MTKGQIMKELAKWLREQADKFLNAPLANDIVKEHVEQLRKWATEVDSSSTLLDELGRLHEQSYELAEQIRAREEYITKLQKELTEVHNHKDESRKTEKQEIEVDEFHRHELLDRAEFILEMLGTLSEHVAHTQSTKEALRKAYDALWFFYQAAADERFKACATDNNSTSKNTDSTENHE